MQESDLLTLQNPALTGRLTTFNYAGFLQFLLPALIRLGFIAGALAFLLMFIYGGVRLSAAGGDKAATEAAKSTLVNAAIGLVILFGLFGIINLFGCFFGIDLRMVSVQTLNVSFIPMPANCK